MQFKKWIHLINGFLFLYVETELKALLEVSDVMQKNNNLHGFLGL